MDFEAFAEDVNALVVRAMVEILLKVCACLPSVPRPASGRIAPASRCLPVVQVHLAIVAHACTLASPHAVSSSLQGPACLF